jgi:thymidylate synthase (FAD)
VAIQPEDVLTENDLNWLLKDGPGEIKYRSDFDVKFIHGVGSDLDIARAAWVSTGQGDPTDDKKVAGLINYLMKHRHGTPFEHNSLTFYVSAPIFVFREWHRHRIGFSYNEVSGRYRKLDPVFYIPGENRPLKTTGSSARPTFEEGFIQAPGFAEGISLNTAIGVGVKMSYMNAWSTYVNMIDKYEVPNEVARIVLPVGIYSSMYVTCNLRSLMAFLSLRTHDENAQFVSYPQWEIEQCARQIESVFAEQYPVVYKAFVDNGRVAP